jgi:hypothetical protein
MCVSSFGLVIPAVNIKPNGKQCALTPSFVHELQTCVAGLFVTVCRSIPAKKKSPSLSQMEIWQRHLIAMKNTVQAVKKYSLTCAQHVNTANSYQTTKNQQNYNDSVTREDTQL